MRIKHGREWVEAGPGRAFTGTARSASVAGYPIGQMRPEVTSKDPLPLKVSAALRHPNPLGMRRRPGR